MGGLAFDEFYESYFDRVARDAAQEAFARALRQWRKVREMDRPDGWVYVVAMNQLRDHWRRSERGRPRAVEVEAGAVDETSGVATRSKPSDLPESFRINLAAGASVSATVQRYLKVGGVDTVISQAQNPLLFAPGNLTSGAEAPPCTGS